MQIVNAAYRIMKPDLDDPKTYPRILREINECGRVSYKSSTPMTNEMAEKFVFDRIREGHETLLEHADTMQVIFTVDRGISHELVRHRLASFTQESTRYCNYSQDKFGNEITVIEPVFFKHISKKVKEYVAYIPLFDSPSEELRYYDWYDGCAYAERAYFRMLKHGCTPEEARTVLPTSLKTEVVVTANLREWRHILNLRAAGTTGRPHPQMLEVMVPLLSEVKMKLPAIFHDVPLAWDEE